MNKTIAIFSCFALPHLGGIERYTDNLIKELNKRDYKVILVSTNYSFEFPLIEKKSDLFVQCFLPIYPFFTNRYPFIKHNAQCKSIESFLDSLHIDAVIVNTRFHLTSLFGSKFGKKRNIPVFLIEHGSQHLTVDNKILDFFGAIYEHALTYFVKKNVDQYYGVSNAACKWQEHFKISSNGIWYNSICDFSENSFESEEHPSDNDNTITILYAGRILKQKGVNNLLDTYCDLKKKHGNIRLVIAGDGNLLPEIREQYTEPEIHFLGQVDFLELQKLYHKSDIFVYVPIWPEGLPTSILEAGLMKCAIIGSPQGGITEIIDHKKNGLLVTSKDELLYSLDLLIRDESLRKRFQTNISSKVKSTFVWSVTCEKIISDINEYITNNKQ